MKGSLYTLAYALVAGTICAATLTAVGDFTRPYIDANEQAEKVRNILGVLGVEILPEATAEDLNALYKTDVKEKKSGDLVMYVLAKDGSVAVEFAGPGLWGPVEGLLAFDAEMKTIRGVSFYKQEETPGLGGEISSDKFRSQFKNLKFGILSNGKPGISILRGEVADKKDHELNGLTGATMTCKKVETMLNDVIYLVVQEQKANGQ